MPLFMTDAELQAVGNDITAIVERAESHIHGLLEQLETQQARADAAAITAEQRCSFVEQKFISMSAQFKQAEQEKRQSQAALERLSGELAKAQSQVHKLELEGMKKDSEREHFSCELIEVRKARKDLLEVLEQKNTELSEKNACIKSYLDKIVHLTDDRSDLQGKLRQLEGEVVRSQALQARLSQEKELLEQHNSWLNNELSDKANALLKEKREFTDLELELRSKLSSAEQSCKEMRESLQSSKEQIKQLNANLNLLNLDLTSTKDEAANKINHLLLEVETAKKLAELYKQSAEEWSKKSVDLEGVIKALEVHLNQVEKESQEKLQKQVEAQKASDKEALELKDELVKVRDELDLYKKDKQQDSIFMIDAFPDLKRGNFLASDEQHLVDHQMETSMLPIVPSGVSGTAIAATLLRDGWSLTKVYLKYQEAVDAWRHERHERKQSQHLLQRILAEIEQRADIIMDERAEHARMVEAYTVMEEKLQACIDEQIFLENTIRDLKAELRKKDRDLDSSKKEESELQIQVAVLVKELEDLRGYDNEHKLSIMNVPRMVDVPIEDLACDATLSEVPRTFKDIQGMVQQNSQLRVLVRSLNHQIEERAEELKVAFDMELKRRTDEAAQKVSTVLKKSEEQMELITSLQGTLGMFKRLYDEELKNRHPFQKSTNLVAITPEGTVDDLRGVIVKSKEEIEKVRKEAAEQMQLLENEITKARKDADSVRKDRDRLIMEATYAREKLETVLKDSEDQRREMDAALARNVEFSQMITDYQRRLRENAEHVQTVEERCLRLSVEVSVLEKEKELISNAEKRASQELSILSGRAHRLQATLDNINMVQESKESMRSAEKKNLEERLNLLQKEWVELKKELDAERVHVRQLTTDHEEALKHAMDKVESISNERADALCQLSVLEARLHAAEARSMELESNLKKAEEKLVLILSGKGPCQDANDNALESEVEALLLLQQAREEIELYKEELNAQKGHTEQYKRLAQINEEALLRIESAHNQYKEQAEKTKMALENEIADLQCKVSDLEKQINERESVFAAAEPQRLEEMSAIQKELTLLREAETSKGLALEQAEEHIQMLKSELEKEHEQRLVAQNNYERQVLLQADTIRELKMSSEAKFSAERELMELREKAERTTMELVSSKAAWEMERASLLSEREDLNVQVKELVDQNKMLLDRLDVAHMVVSDQGKVSVDSSKKTETDLHEVIRFLRRTKETSEMEISLLKQERLRLQKELESALHTVDEVQASLWREQANARGALLSEEEFNSLKAQVREMNILRESNTQLRMENKRNFEECQNLRNRSQKDQVEMESLRKALMERELEYEVVARDADMQKTELSRWQNRVSELLQKYKCVDLEYYKHAQSELASMKEILKSGQSELESVKLEAQRFQEIILKMEQDSSLKDEKIAELERHSLEVSEGPLKAELERLKKGSAFIKRKLESLTKERDDSNREKESLLKQLEDLKANAGRRVSEAQLRLEIMTQHEQAQKESENLLKEKDSRIHTLERTLERERDELRKEKLRRIKDQKTYYDYAQREKTEKQKLTEELDAFKREKENNVETVQAQSTQVRKAGRKIIRPKIESSLNQPSEGGEIAAETSSDMPDTESDAQDDTKLAPAEMAAPAAFSTDIIVAPNMNVLPSEDISNSIRKRSIQVQDSTEEASRRGSKSDIMQIIKRPKHDSKPIVTEMDTVALKVDTAATSDIVEMDVEDVRKASVQFSDIHTSQLTAAVDQQLVDISDNQEMSDIVPSEGHLLEHQQFSMPEILNREDMSVESLSEKGLVESDPQRSIAESAPEKYQAEFVPRDSSLFHEEEQLVTGSDEITHTELLESEPVEGLDGVSNSAFDTSELAPVDAGVIDTQLLHEDMTPLEKGAESLADVIDPMVSIDNDLQAEGVAEPFRTTVEDFAEEEHTSMKVSETETANEGTSLGTSLDVEDGEIEPDDQEEEINLESTLERDREDEGKSENVSNFSVELDPIHLEEVKDVETIRPSDPSAQGTKEMCSEEVPTVLTTQDKPNVDVAVVQADNQSRTRQATRNTTASSTDRVRERTLIRSGMPPPSTARWMRNIKKSSTLQQARSSSTEQESHTNVDEEAEISAAHQSQSMPETKKMDTSKDGK